MELTPEIKVRHNVFIANKNKLRLVDKYMYKLIRLIILASFSFIISLYAIYFHPLILLNISLVFAQTTNKICPDNYLIQDIPSDFLPKAVLVNCVQGKRVVIHRGNRYEPGKPNAEIDYNSRLGTPSDKGTGATLGFVSKSNQKINNLAAAGFSETESWYRYGCNGIGSLSIGWSSTLEKERQSPCKTFKYEPQRTKWLNPNRRKSLKVANNEPGQPIAPDIGGAPVNGRKYCSFASPKGGWSVKFVSLTSDENVCTSALKDCENKIGNSCLVTNLGEWRDYDPDRTKLNLLLQCADGKSHYRRGEGKDIYALARDLEEEAKGKTSCVLHIYRNDEVLISANDRQRTLIHTETTDNGFAIHNLIGQVTITAADPKKVTPVVLNAGERYRFIDTTSEAKPDQLSLKEREEIVNLPVVKAFLDFDNWNNDIDPEIAEYQKAVKEQFYQPPAVFVDKTTVAGVSIWLASIDLNNPQTIVTFAPTNIVQKAGGLNSFVQKSNATLIASGTFREDKNWTMKSEGSFIVGEDFKNWPYYTVLGLNSRNIPEIIARNQLSEPKWEQYWFAITGHPRLVNNGVAGVTEIAPGATLNITGSARRAAIGFSRQTKMLYHVITNDRINLKKMAEVMKAIGCDEAINLEGNDGTILAYSNTIKVSGQVRAPLIMVYEATKAPENIRTGWKRFQNVTSPSASNR